MAIAIGVVFILLTVLLEVLVRDFESYVESKHK